PGDRRFPVGPLGAGQEAGHEALRDTVRASDPERLELPVPKNRTDVGAPGPTTELTRHAAAESRGAPRRPEARRPPAAAAPRTRGRRRTRRRSAAGDARRVRVRSSPTFRREGWRAGQVGSAPGRAVSLFYVRDKDAVSWKRYSARVPRAGGATSTGPSSDDGAEADGNGPHSRSCLPPPRRAG